ncbi:SDR family NAD(P)-dependent oxidoreductase [Labrys monachus]|uniref:NAD(P)-dependent dehydrogenase (Short-subunit alcohol dehydrogenase family) n=1 Tax=Labrys monachus TaxID=217067 RepID=A0ABU0F8L9_9HYPH|nr:SDR family NAD(P)-dependent oxidoreductase [Labrys monachus]MDQ0390957.1 NAD(P)-dependent dehydrogenase (short-subunit alcohol dehydrogenase family) [Labrys monachus]
MPRDHRRVLITGAGSGIGRALAIEASRRGMSVALCGRRAEALEETLGLLVPAPGHIAIAADVTAGADRRRILDDLMEEWGALDILVNNAGVLEGGALERMDDEALARIFETNAIAPIALAREMLALLQAGRAARIVNIGSIFGDIPYPLLAAYSASKFALRGFSGAIRREWKPKGIGVTYVAPRATRTAALTSLGGFMATAGMRVDTPERVARYVWDSIERGADAVYAPGPERLFVLLQRIFPGLLDRALARPAKPVAG